MYSFDSLILLDQLEIRKLQEAMRQLVTTTLSDQRPSEIQEYIRENAAVEVNQNCVSRFILNNNDFTDKWIPYNRFCSLPQIVFFSTARSSNPLFDDCN